MHGCGHSFHTQYLPSGEVMCLICKDEIAVSLKSLCAKACEGLRHQFEKTVEDRATEFQNDDANNAEDLVCKNEADQDT